MSYKELKGDGRAVSTTIMAVIVVVIVVVAGIAAYVFLLGDDGGGEDEPTLSDMQVGDYLEYQKVASSGDSVLNYTFWYNVTAVNSTSFTIKETEHLNGFFYGEWNRTVAKDEVMNIIIYMPEGMDDMGTMSLDTPMGAREVRHFQGIDMGEYLDFYFGVSNGMLYRYHYVLGGTTGEMNLVDSNLGWV